MKLKYLTLGLALSASLSLGVAAQTLTPRYIPLLRAGDVASLKTALDQGLDPNATDAAGNTPLMLTATYGNVDGMELLLAKGARVNEVNKAGASALLRSAGDYNKTALLLKHGADLKVRSAFGNTPLILAARVANGHRTVKLLLDNGAKADEANNFGGSALMAAVASGDLQSVKMLIKHGANVNGQPMAKEEGFVFGGGRSALMWAAFHGDIPAAKALLAAGAKINDEGALGTALSQATWAGKADMVNFLLNNGANAQYMTHHDSFTALHWTALSEDCDSKVAKLLLDHGADANFGGGDTVDAYMGIPQTPLLLAQRRSDTALVKLLTQRGATNDPDTIEKSFVTELRPIANANDPEAIRMALSQAIPPLQRTSLESRPSFATHGSKQQCTSCHQQYLPLAAMGAARKLTAVDEKSEQRLIEMVGEGEFRSPEPDLEPVFHPDAAYTKGYSLFGCGNAQVPASIFTDASVVHLAAIQAADGHWYNNLPRPPIQAGDIGATALAIYGLQHYPLPGRKAEFAERVERARQWLRSAKPANNGARVYQILGLAWAGESRARLAPLAKALADEQRADGGWAQRSDMNTDAYATAQSVYALRAGAGYDWSTASLSKGRKYLLASQLDDGTWHVRRRAFPFQPTMPSGFPHGKDSWISSAASSWAVLALSLVDEPQLARAR